MTSTHLGAFLDDHRRVRRPGDLLYTLSPLPTNNLFIAAGMVGVNLAWVLAGFWTGRILADTFWVWTTNRASRASAISSGRHRRPLAIALQSLSLVSLLLLYRLPWARWLRRTFDRNEPAADASLTPVVDDQRSDDPSPRPASPRSRATSTNRIVRRPGLPASPARAAVALGRHLRIVGRQTASRKREQFVMRTAEDVTRTMGEMKGAVMKFGQILSLMSGVLPDEMSAAARHPTVRRAADGVPPGRSSVRARIRPPAAEDIPALREGALRRRIDRPGPPRDACTTARASP